MARQELVGIVHQARTVDGHVQIAAGQADILKLMVLKIIQRIHGLAIAQRMQNGFDEGDHFGNEARLRGPGGGQGAGSHPFGRAHDAIPFCRHAKTIPSGAAGRGTAGAVGNPFWSVLTLALCEISIDQSNECF